MKPCCLHSNFTRFIIHTKRNEKVKSIQSALDWRSKKKSKKNSYFLYFEYNSCTDWQNYGVEIEKLIENASVPLFFENNVPWIYSSLFPSSHEDELVRELSTFSSHRRANRHQVLLFRKPKLRKSLYSNELRTLQTSLAKRLKMLVMTSETASKAW